MTKIIPGPVKGYKICNDDLTCRGFHYKLGELVSVEGPIEMCGNGLHFCTQPSGVWSYYNKGRVFEIEAYDVLDTHIDPGARNKMVCRAIKLVREINVDCDHNNGNGNTGNNNTGDRNTGNSNNGNHNTGSHNTGNGNSGSHNNGNGNSGYCNIGNGNTGNYNYTNKSSGYFNTKERIFMFDRVCDEVVNMRLAHRLYDKISKDAEFDYEPFLSLPNATPARIKHLHEVAIKTRKEKNND